MILDKKLHGMLINYTNPQKEYKTLETEENLKILVW